MWRCRRPKKSWRGVYSLRNKPKTPCCRGTWLVILLIYPQSAFWIVTRRYTHNVTKLLRPTTPIVWITACCEKLSSKLLPRVNFDLNHHTLASPTLNQSPTSYQIHADEATLRARSDMNALIQTEAGPAIQVHLRTGHPSNGEISSLSRSAQGLALARAGQSFTLLTK